MRRFCVLFIVFLSGCVGSPKENEATETSPLGDFKIKVIDSCEYIEYDWGWGDQRVYSLTHKGNCKYCVKKKLFNGNNN